jgi:hypothetical protein
MQVCSNLIRRAGRVFCHWFFVSWEGLIQSDGIPFSLFPVYLSRSRSSFSFSFVFLFIVSLSSGAGMEKDKDKKKDKDKEE